MEASHVLPLLATQKIQTTFAGLKPSPSSSTATMRGRPEPTEASRRLRTASFGYRVEARRHAHNPLFFKRDPKDALITSLFRVDGLR